MKNVRTSEIGGMSVDAVAKELGCSHAYVSTLQNKGLRRVATFLLDRIKPDHTREEVETLASSEELADIIIQCFKRETNDYN
jgi:hypothetical protein